MPRGYRHDIGVLPNCICMLGTRVAFSGSRFEEFCDCEVLKWIFMIFSWSKKLVLSQTEDERGRVITSGAQMAVQFVRKQDSLGFMWSLFAFAFLSHS